METRIPSRSSVQQSALGRKLLLRSPALAVNQDFKVIGLMDGMPSTYSQWQLIISS